MDKNIKNQRGYATVELLFYIALFAVLALAVINGMLMMTRAFREVSVQSELLQSGNVMEKISREIKQAMSINTITGSSLTLNTKDSSGANKTVQFNLSGSDLQFLENTVLTGNLNNPNISVSNLSFAEITTTQGKAVKVSFSVLSTNDKLNRSKNFYNTIVLRGNY